MYNVREIVLYGLLMIFAVFGSWYNSYSHDQMQKNNIYSPSFDTKTRVTIICIYDFSNTKTYFS